MDVVFSYVMDCTCIRIYTIDYEFLLLGYLINCDNFSNNSNNFSYPFKSLSYDFPRSFKFEYIYITIFILL